METNLMATNNEDRYGRLTGQNQTYFRLIGNIFCSLKFYYTPPRYKRMGDQFWRWTADFFREKLDGRHIFVRKTGRATKKLAITRPAFYTGGGVVYFFRFFNYIPSNRKGIRKII